MSMKHNDITKKYDGQVVGRIRVKTPVEHTRTYECAAWQQNSVSGTGTFDLFLGEGYHHPHELFLYAKLPATIKDDYFQSFFGGVACGKAYDTHQNTGKPAQDVVYKLNVVEAIQRSGNTPDGKDYDAVVYPEIWQDIIDHYRAKLEGALEYLKSCAARYADEGDGEYRSNLSSLGYAGGEVRRLTKAIDELERKLGYLNEHTDMWRRLHRDNTVWAKEDAA